MQYFNAIHCDRNISTSELKNPSAVSPRIQQLLRIHTVRTRHRHGRPQPAVTVTCIIVDKRAVSFRLVCLV